MPNSPTEVDLLDRPIAVLSPHSDDAALSCGGLLIRNPDAKVITIFDGDCEASRQPTPASVRREEDRSCWKEMAVSGSSLGFLDAIDRRNAEGSWVYPKLRDVFSMPSREDIAMAKELLLRLREEVGDRLLLSPLAVGAHVDHQIVAQTAHHMQKQGVSVRYYCDLPYGFPDAGPRIKTDTPLLASRRLRSQLRGQVDIEIDAEAKAQAVALYPSQVEALFDGMGQYRALAEGHYAELGSYVERYFLLA